MASRIQIRGGTAAQWTTANPVLAAREMAMETDTNKLKMGDGVTAWLLLPYAYSFLTLADADETTRGIVEEATDAEVLAGTAVGGTGAKLFITPAKLKAFRDLAPVSVAASGGVLTLNCSSKQEVKFLCTSTISGNTSISVTNATNLIALHLTIPITGGAIQLTWPSTTRMSRYFEVTSGDGWYQSSKILVVSSISADDLWEFSLIKMGSIYKLNHDGPARA